MTTATTNVVEGVQTTRVGLTAIKAVKCSSSRRMDSLLKVYCTRPISGGTFVHPEHLMAIQCGAVEGSAVQSGSSLSRNIGRHCCNLRITDLPISATQISPISVTDMVFSGLLFCDACGNLLERSNKQQMPRIKCGVCATLTPSMPTLVSCPDASLKNHR